MNHDDLQHPPHAADVLGSADVQPAHQGRGTAILRQAASTSVPLAAVLLARRIDALEDQILHQSLIGADDAALRAYALQGVDLRARYMEACDILQSFCPPS